MKYVRNLQFSGILIEISQDNTSSPKFHQMADLHEVKFPLFQKISITGFAISEYLTN